jgi:hypothetical protein
MIAITLPELVSAAIKRAGRLIFISLNQTLINPGIAIFRVFSGLELTRKID